MTNPVIMQLQIDLQNFKKGYAEAQIKAQRLLNEIITLVASPYFESPHDLRTDEIKQAAADLSAAKNQLIEFEKHINRIKKELGEA